MILRIIATGLLALAAMALPAPGALAQSPSEAVAVARLGLDIERAESVRSVKRLHAALTQYASFGMWDDMADLFATSGEYIADNEAGGVRGREAIRAYFVREYGGGKSGLPRGGLHADFFMSPVVTLSADGERAKARWQVLSMLGRYGGEARWTGAMQENEYVREGGAWKIARLLNYPQLAGPYETGFFAAKPKLPLIPYHYTPAQAGAPAPPVTSDLLARAKTPAGGIDALDRRAAAMNDEDKIRNLQNAYGYYVDRKMWDDVTDLFSADGVMEIAGVGIYRTPRSVRRAVEREGPPNLSYGQVNDHIQMSMIVTVAPGGAEATARGVELGMLSPKLGEAYWSVSVFQNRYIKQNGVWRVREMRIYPLMKTDYYQGWAKSAVIDGAPVSPLAPDQPSAASNSPQQSGAIVAFMFANPATDKPSRYPEGKQLVGGDRLTPAAPSEAARSSQKPFAERLAEAQRKLAISAAYDGVENVSSAYGFYLDDFQWQPMVEIYTADGQRQKTCCGFYIGRENIFKAESMSYGPMPVDRDWVRLHTRLQPVIDVSPDAKYAYLRTRLFIYGANRVNAGSWNSGMYANEAARLEDGVWRMRVAGGIDEPYFTSPSYKEGWAKPSQQAGAGGPLAARGAQAPRRPRLPDDFPPDIPISALGLRGEGFVRSAPNYTSWPEIKPMWFHYRNPVSGRAPPNYCPDITTCYKTLTRQ